MLAMCGRFVCIVLSLTLAGFAHSDETLWAKGVSEQSGWFDFNKSPNRSDSNLCWAIAASNLISWWQNQQMNLPGDVPRGDSVWHTFRTAFTNLGSDPDEGLRWWFTGGYTPRVSALGLPSAVLKNATLGGYYKERGEQFFRSLYYRDRRVNMPVSVLSKALYEGVSRGDAFWIGVSYLKRDGKRYTHSLNVWGIDVEKSNADVPKILAIYMTDSDDGRVVLHRIPMREKDGRLLFDCPKHRFYGRIGDITVNNFTALRAELK